MNLKAMVATFNTRKAVIAGTVCVVLATLGVVQLSRNASTHNLEASSRTTRASEIWKNTGQIPLRDEAHSTFDYLLMRYDADSDGAVSRSEYDRGERTFQRLDHNRDGKITSNDFTDRGGRPGQENVQIRMRQLRSQRMLASYFQNNSTAETLRQSEVRSAFQIFDVDDDEVVSEGEFTGFASERYVEIPGAGSRQMRALLRDIAHWDALVGAIDTDTSNSISLNEVVTFFAAHDAGDGAWQVLAPEEPGRSYHDVARTHPQGGPTVGSIAPDFNLQPPDGGAAVSLSSFSGHKPVALIFGSYT